MLYKNFFKLFSPRDGVLCVLIQAVPGARLLFSLFSRRLISRGSENSQTITRFPQSPRAYPPDARRVSKSAPASASSRRGKFTRAYVRVRTVASARADRREAEGGGRRERGINYAHRDCMTREPWFSSPLREEDDDDAAAVPSLTCAPAVFHGNLVRFAEVVDPFRE